MQQYQAPPGVLPQAPATAYAYGYADQASSSRKNVLGILSLIFPFVGLALVGIILGHLGLSAVRKGDANNRGVALAGTIISWVFTLGTVALISAAVAVSGAFEGEGAIESSARVDLQQLQTTVNSHHRVYGFVPEVTLADGVYSVGDVTLLASSSVSSVNLVVLRAEEYCIELTYDGGTESSIRETGDPMSGGCATSNTGSAAGSPNGVQADPETTTDTDASGGLASLTALVLGDCILDPYDTSEELEDGSILVDGFQIVDCAEPHFGEVYALGTATGDAYDADVVYLEADDICWQQFEAFVGMAYVDSMLYYEPYYPTAAGWKFGDRQVTCIVTAYDNTTVGSFAGSAQ